MKKEQVQYSTMIVAIILSYFMDVKMILVWRYTLSVTGWCHLHASTRDDRIFTYGMLSCQCIINVTFEVQPGHLLDRLMLSYCWTVSELAL